MTQNIVSLMAPEVTLTIGAVLVLLIGLTRFGSRRTLSGWLALAAVAVAFVITWYTGLPEHPLRAPGLRVTNLAWYVRIVALGLVALLAVALTWLARRMSR